MYWLFLCGCLLFFVLVFCLVVILFVVGGVVCLVVDWLGGFVVILV